MEVSRSILKEMKYGHLTELQNGRFFFPNKQISHFLKSVIIRVSYINFQVVEFSGNLADTWIGTDKKTDKNTELSF